MATHSVDLTEREAATLDRLVATGAFPDAEAALAHGLELLLKDEAEIAAFVEEVGWVHRRMLRGEQEPGLDEAATRRAFRAARRAWAAEVGHSQWLGGRNG